MYFKAFKAYLIFFLTADALKTGGDSIILEGDCINPLVFFWTHWQTKETQDFIFEKGKKYMGETLYWNQGGT